MDYSVLNDVYVIYLEKLNSLEFSKCVCNFFGNVFLKRYSQILSYTHTKGERFYKILAHKQHLFYKMVAVFSLAYEERYNTHTPK